MIGIYIRIEDDEKLIIEKRAKEWHMTLSAYCRMRLMQEEPESFHKPTKHEITALPVKLDVVQLEHGKIPGNTKISDIVDGG